MELLQLGFEKKLKFVGFMLSSFHSDSDSDRKTKEGKQFSDVPVQVEKSEAKNGNFMHLFSVRERDARNRQIVDDPNLQLKINVIFCTSNFSAVDIHTGQHT